MKYFVYFLKSSNVNKFYIGVTINMEDRLKQHNNGKTKSTKPYKPWRIIYFENYSDKSEAYKREWFLKHPVGYLDKLDIIKKFGGVA